MYLKGRAEMHQRLSGPVKRAAGLKQQEYPWSLSGHLVYSRRRRIVYLVGFDGMCKLRMSGKLEGARLAIAAATERSILLTPCRP